ncbi:B12-binding domain-containing radical SAM protein [Desulfamplus magnetovallimortis]|uniref:B12-binding domain-containing radical SAM protein n=1 Tax=Desulfamplus magnetovallimortis TaxID=1246637 RepID=UPI001FE252D0|nr:radical SAM protein [Desulfamplus magnetovallimortis]
MHKIKNSNKPHILCVNPWIHDFAAFDFWAKPLGLLQLAAIIRESGVSVTFLDCLDRFHPEALRKGKVKLLGDGRGPFRKKSVKPPSQTLPDLQSTGKRFFRYGIEPEWFYKDLVDLKKANPPDLILVTSMMTYWASGVSETISVVKKVFPDTPVVLGGIYASLCREHAEKHSLADQVVTGTGEEVIQDIVKEYTGYCITPEKESNHRFQQPTDLENLPFPALDLVSRLTYAPILTSRGCPFSCDYCASSFLEKSLRRRSSEKVFQEIAHWHLNYGVKIFAFYDDALLIQPEKYILPLLEKILCSSFSSDLSFHTPNALHIRQITREVTEMMYRTGFKTIRLGLETTDFSPSARADKKVRKEEFHNAVRMLKKAGFTEEQTGAYLLCALPGQDLDDVESSIKLVKQSGITPVLAYYTPIPHTPMWKEAVRNSRFDLEKDPLFTNNALMPCLKDESEMDKILQLKKMTSFISSQK